MCFVVLRPTGCWQRASLFCPVGLVRLLWEYERRRATFRARFFTLLLAREALDNTGDARGLMGI
jgi:hypothetical protein